MGHLVANLKTEGRCEDSAGPVETWNNFDPLEENWATVGPVKILATIPTRSPFAKRLVSEGDGGTCREQNGRPTFADPTSGFLETRRLVSANRCVISRDDIESLGPCGVSARLEMDPRLRIETLDRVKTLPFSALFGTRPPIHPHDPSNFRSHPPDPRRPLDNSHFTLDK